jgi:hypothetical protein
MSKPTTFDEHQKHLTVEYKEAAATAAPTTHDLVSARLIVEAAPNKIGDRQVMSGQVYEWNGDKWAACL